MVHTHGIHALLLSSGGLVYSEGHAAITTTQLERFRQKEAPLPHPSLPTPLLPARATPELCVDSPVPTSHRDEIPRYGPGVLLLPQHSVEGTTWSRRRRLIPLWPRNIPPHRSHIYQFMDIGYFHLGFLNNAAVNLSVHAFISLG